MQGREHSTVSPTPDSSPNHRPVEAVIEGGQEKADVLIASLERVMSELSSGRTVEVVTCSERLTDVAVWRRIQRHQLASAQTNNGDVRIWVTKSDDTSTSEGISV